jgi:hypothetical protein
MFSNIPKHFTYANIAATLALIFATSGSALAVNNSGFSMNGGGISPANPSASVARATGGRASSLALASAAKAKAKKTKAPARGPAGPKGATGAAGPAGPGGPAGPAGGKGENGAAGSNGTNGTSGESVKVASIATGASECAGHGGAKFTVGSEKAEACNGQTGFTETLPEGKTLKGDWSMTAYAKATFPEGFLTTGVSFDIPLAAAPNAVHLVAAPTKEEEEKDEFPTPPAGCTGNVADPGAEAGNLCVFAREEEDLGKKKICPAGSPQEGIAGETPIHCIASGTGTPEAADPSGFDIVVVANADGLVRYAGTWAVSAE